MMKWGKWCLKEDGGYEGYLRVGFIKLGWSGILYY